MRWQAKSVMRLVAKRGRRLADSSLRVLSTALGTDGVSGVTVNNAAIDGDRLAYHVITRAGREVDRHRCHVFVVTDATRWDA